MDIIFFEYINQFRESRGNKYSFFVLYTLDSLMQHLLNDRCQVISGLSLRHFVEIHKHRDKRSLTVCGHKRDHLILDHLHTTVDLFSYTHLCYFIDFLLIQIQPDLFKLCPDLYPEFFTAHLYERCQMGQ